ncbi:hypothetical protein FIV07_27740 (plasmid) [Mycobacterium sp. THAF192]|nr:hypothetical protein FIV07_27740 [Mycobacterium sp. THAF192]
MTTSYTPEPRPDDPSTPSSNPAVPDPAPDLTAARTPDNDTDAEAAVDTDTTPEDDATSVPGEDTAEVDAPQTGPGDTDTALEPEDLTDTYTTTEPGFPIGELIAALVQPGISAASMLPTLAMSLPSTAMGLAGPLLGSLVALLGQNAQQPPSSAGRATPPPSTPSTGLPHAEGPAAAAYRDRDAETAEHENKVRDRDARTDDVVARGNETQAQARHNIATIAADLDAAARRAPGDPEGQAALNAHIRQSLHNARTVVLRAGSEYQQIATDFARV